MIRQQRAEAAKKREEEKAGMIIVSLTVCLYSFESLFLLHNFWCFHSMVFPHMGCSITMEQEEDVNGFLVLFSCGCVFFFSDFPWDEKRLIVIYLFLSAKEQKKAEARKWKIQETPSR